MTENLTEAKYMCYAVILFNYLSSNTFGSIFIQHKALDKDCFELLPEHNAQSVSFEGTSNRDYQ